MPNTSRATPTRHRRPSGGPELWRRGDVHTPASRRGHAVQRTNCVLVDASSWSRGRVMPLPAPPSRPGSAHDANRRGHVPEVAYRFRKRRSPVRTGRHVHRTAPRIRQMDAEVGETVRGRAALVPTKRLKLPAASARAHPHTGSDP